MKAKDIAIAILENPNKTARELSIILDVCPKRIHKAANYYGYRLAKHKNTALYEVYGKKHYLKSRGSNGQTQ